jgi:predicted patatin/cPLA2 family phospholipase
MPCLARLAAMLLLAFGLAGCHTATRLPAVPEELSDVAHPFGMTGLRSWGDKATDEEVDEFIHARVPMLRKLYAAELKAHHMPHEDWLALSGGGQFGAFAAGILNAWGQSGTRPTFMGVSGISTGAIIAPFAFLGAEYDHVLREIYSRYATEDLVESTLLSGLLFGNALASTDRLAKVIEQYVTQELLDLIAAEHRKGRLLYIGTTNLDAGRPMLWDITAIAASGQPGALDLVRKLIRGSAAIPVAFPPIMVDVVAPDGRVFSELHVDGGASSQVTFIAADIPLAAMTREALGRNIERRLWVIVNNDLEPPHQMINPRIGAIGKAAVSSLIRGSGVGDIYRLFAIAKRDEVDMRVTWIPTTIPCEDPKEDFDRAFMSCLYEHAGELFRGGKLWHDKPPYYVHDPAPPPAPPRRR